MAVDVQATPSGKWRGRVKYRGVHYHVGIFGSEEAARSACRAEMACLLNGTSSLLVPGGTDTVRSFSDALGVREGTVKRWVHEGMPVVRSGRVLRIDRAAARAWVEEHRRDSVAFDRKGVVYVARRSGDGAVKIGWTSDVARRMRELSNGQDVVLVAALPGDKPKEQELHRRFADRALGGEWFDVPATAVVDALREVA